MTETTSLSGGFDAGYGHETNALLLAASGRVDPAIAETVTAAGIRGVGDWTAFADADAALERPASFRMILVEAAGASDDAAARVFAHVARAAHKRRLGVVATITPDQIDVAATHLIGSGCQLLCDPGITDRVSAYLFAARRDATVNDVTRDPESVRLKRLNEEVARIADTLARLTRGEIGDRNGTSLRDPGTSYRGPEAGAPPIEISAQEIRSVIRARRLRNQFFTGDLFADPAWDMLLDLFAADLEGRRVSVSSLCIAAAVPPTTALRWIGTMHESGLFERHADPADRRRAYIALSATGLDAMQRYAATVHRHGLTLA